MTRATVQILRFFLLWGMAAGLGACTMVGGGVQPPPGPRPVAHGPVGVARPAPAVEIEEERGAERITAGVVDTALEAIGAPYEWGGSGANGFDCSGLIRFAYGKLGIQLPRTSAAQMRAGSPVAPEPSSLRPGDVLGFSGDRSGKTDHVGMYIGADEFIHSSSTGVRISTFRNPFWREHLVAARRIVD